MEITPNPYKLHDEFKNLVKQFLKRQIKNGELDLSILEVSKYIQGITFNQTDTDSQWSNQFNYLLTEKIIYELNLIWDGILNP